jgi:hypothetical protein
MRQNWHMNAHSAGAAEKQFLINIGSVIIAAKK